jgi:site-specific DNA recombinase
MSRLKEAGMTSLPVAIYARVSSDQQTDAHTIASQLAALRARVATDGFGLPDELQFIDEDYSGATWLTDKTMWACSSKSE